MLRDNYKKAFSQINPSEETIEKVFEMTEKKHFNRIRKGLIIAIALIAILLCGSLTANAATDGALFEGITLIMNGEKVDLKDYIVNHNSYVDEDGAKVEEYEFHIDEDENGGSLIFEVKGDQDAFSYVARVTENEDGSYPEYSPEQIDDLSEKVINDFAESFETDETITNTP